MKQTSNIFDLEACGPGVVIVSISEMLSRRLFARARLRRPVLLSIASSRVQRLSSSVDVDIQAVTAPPSGSHVDFDDAVGTYGSKSTSEIIRALVVYRISSVPFLVNNAATITGLARSVLGLLTRSFVLFMFQVNVRGDLF